MSTSYEDKLRDPRWLKLRFKKLEEVEWKCEVCGDTREEFNIHHVGYIFGRDPWDYPTASLRCLCRTCHEMTHRSGDKVVKFARHLLAIGHGQTLQAWQEKPEEL